MSKTQQEVKADVNAMMDPLFHYMENDAPKEQRDRFRNMLGSVHRSMKYTMNQLLITRLAAIALGILYLLK